VYLLFGLKLLGLVEEAEVAKPPKLEAEVVVEHLLGHVFLLMLCLQH